MQTIQFDIKWDAGDKEFSVEEIAELLENGLGRDYDNTISNVRLGAAVSVSPQPRWLPIETAPKDGRHIQAANFSGKDFGRDIGFGSGQSYQCVVHWWQWCDGTHQEEWGWYPSTGAGESDALTTLTHWKPLEEFFAAAPAQEQRPANQISPAYCETHDTVHKCENVIAEAQEQPDGKFEAAQIAGAGPKVEEIAQKVYDAVIGDDVRWLSDAELLETIAAILRPYFPPASQTPDFSQLVSVWPAINRFRGQLIDRKISGRLENGDRDILDALQVFANWYLEAVVPRDTSVLEKLEQLLATPASTARTDAAHKIPSELALRHWAELIAVAALGPRSDREAYKEAAGYVLGQLGGFADEYCAAPGSVPQAPAEMSHKPHNPCNLLCQHDILHDECLPCISALATEYFEAWEKECKLTAKLTADIQRIADKATGVPQAEPPKEEKP